MIYLRDSYPRFRGKPRVLVDVDGVLGDLTGDLCAILRLSGFDRWPEDVTNYSYEESLPEDEIRILRHAMTVPGFVANMTWYPGAQDFLRELRKVAQVVAVTRPYEKGPTWAYERAQWLDGHVDAIVQTGHKELVDGWTLIEDSAQNLFTWTAEHDRVGLLLRRPWNFGVYNGRHIWECTDYDYLLDSVKAIVGYEEARV